MGVALLTLLIGGTYLFLVRIPWRSWFAVGVLGVASLAALWTFVLAPYQKERILTVVDPDRDPLASGFQSAQSRIAIGSGGMFGTGYLEGTQAQLRFLPAQHTDFAFSVLAEEWGFVGSCVTLGVYVTLLIWGLVWRAAPRTSSARCSRSASWGVCSGPPCSTVAMVVGLAPVIGVPLPLFSYGGSALVVTCALLGLLMNVSMRRYVF
jgi:rod shape determining protein RodA